MRKRPKVDNITSVTFTDEQAKSLRAMAKARSWTISETVRYAVDKVVGTEKHDATTAA